MTVPYLHLFFFSSEGVNRAPAIGAISHDTRSGIVDIKLFSIIGPIFFFLRGGERGIRSGRPVSAHVRLLINIESGAGRPSESYGVGGDWLAFMRVVLHIADRMQKGVIGCHSDV